MKHIYVPSKIKSLINNKSYIIDDIGMSGNQVLIFDDMVLKIENESESVRKQVEIMKWLESKIPVPKVIEFEEENAQSYLLMSRVVGEMSCDEYYLERPEVLVRALADGLKMLWNIDVSGCPRERDLEEVLKEARYQVENNLVDLDNVETDTFGENGFESPKHLLEWLENNKPSYEPAFSHGDYCLPNVLLEGGQIKGFIDLDRAGICDKWNDIALCYRSLKHNFAGLYGGKIYEDFDPCILFDALEIEPNWEKIKYYLLLDELI